MLKRDIKYVDFDGNDAVDTCYFNLTKTEILEYQLKHPGNFIQIIVDTKDFDGIWREIKNVIRLSYGVRSPDGKRFIKNDDIWEEFTQTPAFDSLIMELVTNEAAAATFISAIIPAEMREELSKAFVEPNKTESSSALPPPAPTEV